MPPDAGSGSHNDLVGALVARIDDIDAQLRATAAAVDEKSLKEFRRTVEVLSKRDEKFEERVTNKVDVVADRLETLARTVSTTSAALAAKDGEIAQLRRDLDAGSARVQTALADTKRGQDPAELTEIKRTLAELSKQKLPRGLEGRIEELGSKVTMLAQRIDTVSSTVSTTAAGLAGRDGDVIALRRAYDADSDRIGAELAEIRRAIDLTPVTELRQAVVELRERTSDQRRTFQHLFGEANMKADSLATRVDTLADSVTSTSARVSGAEEHLSALRAHVEEGVIHLNSLAAAVASTSERLDARDAELETLERRFHEASTRVDTLADSVTSTSARVSGGEEQLSALRAHVEEGGVHLNSLAAAVASTSERLDARDAELETLERRFHEASTRVDTLADSVTSTSARVSGGEEQLSALRAHVEEGGVHLNSLAAAVASTSERLDARDAELETLERRFHEASTRVDTLADSVSSTSARVSGSEEQLSALRAHVEEGGVHLNSLAAAVASTSERLDARDAELETLGRRFHDASTRVDGLVGELSRALAEFPDPASTKQALESRLNELDRVRANDRVRVEELADRLESSVATLAGEAPEIEELDRRLDDLVTRIDAVDDDRAGASSEMARLAAILEVERAGVRSRLESLAAAQDSRTGTVSADELEESVAGFAGRVEAIEHEREALAARVSRLASAFDTERASFQTQLEALAAALSWTSPRSSVDERLEELDQRMRDLERDSTAVASRVSQATTLLPSALRSLEARLDEIAPASRETPVPDHLPPVYSAPGEPEQLAEDVEHEPNDDETTVRLTSGVVPIRGTDP